MAQNVTIAGAQYPSVPAVDIPKTGGGTARFVDTSDANAIASDILQGKIAYVNGQKITGTGSGGGGTIIELPPTSDWESTTFTLDNNYFISSDYTIPTGYTLIIPESYFLIIKYNSSYPTLTNNGTIRIPSGTNSNKAVIYLFEDCNLVNNGLIQLNDGIIYVEQDASLTNSFNSTINGSNGMIFNYLGEITNNGTWGSSVKIENKWGDVTGATIFRDWVLSEPLTATENRTYTAPSGTAYSPVTVDVSGGGGTECDLYAGKDAPSGAVNGDLWLDISDEPTGKAVQISNASSRRSGTSYGAISNVTLTVEKTGTYDVYWSGFRSATSGTFGTQLYKNGTSSGSAQTTFSNHEQHPHLSNVSLSVGDVLTIQGRSGSTSNYIYASNLIIIEVGD